ncbi:clavesin-2-like [Rhopilema esculentum]|uniref:clavesin-2-like n=1 Tax=Rhopilema esculentum TaxID=499914 RepID=UPI0031D59211|eukprot:gene8046-13960_t
MVDIYASCENVCENARQELNERIDTRSFDIEALRDRMSERPDVYFERKDDEFLLQFLRARKFDKDRAFNLLVNYCRFRRRHRQFFRSLRASCLRPVFEDGLPMVMPERDHLGRSIVIMFPGNWNTKLYTFDDILRSLLLTMEYLIESERTQVCGVVFIVDFTGWRLSDASHLNKSHLIDAIKVFQDCFPARFKGVHFVNQPWYVRLLMAVIRPILKQKAQNRIHFHGKDVLRLHSYVHPSVLPPDLCGDLKVSDKSWLYKALLDREVSKHKS